jgi:hypothetical protein
VRLEVPAERELSGVKLDVVKGELTWIIARAQTARALNETV